MIKKNILLVVLLFSGIMRADCPERSHCSKQCSTDSDCVAACDRPCCYRMRAMLCEDGQEICRKEGPTKSGSLVFEDYDVQVMVVEEREDGVVVRVCIMNDACPASQPCKDECKALPVEDDASSCEPSEDPCLKHVPWGQEVVISCSSCKYSMRIVVEKSE